SYIASGSHFSCPICQNGSFSREELLDHVNTRHANSTGLQLICPICIAMPWGDPNQKSEDILRHLNLRHRFDYNMFI
ncbi:uncharacterized protein TRIADDRAFT_8381, partial [Trichoplax adhaerens]